MAEVTLTCDDDRHVDDALKNINREPNEIKLKRSLIAIVVPPAEQLEQKEFKI